MEKTTVPSLPIPQPLNSLGVEVEVTWGFLMILLPVLMTGIQNIEFRKKNDIQLDMLVNEFA